MIYCCASANVYNILRDLYKVPKLLLALAEVTVHCEYQQREDLRSLGVNLGVAEDRRSTIIMVSEVACSW